MNLAAKLTVIASASLLLPASTVMAGGSGVSPKAGSAINGTKQESGAQPAPSKSATGATPLSGSNSTAITSGHDAGVSSSATTGK